MPSGVDADTGLQYVDKYPEGLPAAFGKPGDIRALFVSEVEKVSSRGLVQDRVVVVNKVKFITLTKGGEVRRYQDVKRIAKVRWQEYTHKGLKAIRVLVVIPSEKDELVLFTAHRLGDRYETNARNFMNVIQALRDHHSATDPTAQYWEGLQIETPTANLKLEANLIAGTSSQFKSPTKLISSYKSAKRSPSATRSTASPRTSQDTTPVDARHSTTVTQQQPQQQQGDAPPGNEPRPPTNEEWTEELEQHFIALRAINSWMDEQLQDKTAEADSLRAKNAELEKRIRSPPMSPEDRQRKVSFIDHAAPGSVGSGQEAKALQEEVKVLTKQLEDLEKGRTEDAVQIQELMTLVDGLVNEKECVVRENIRLEAAMSEKGKAEGKLFQEALKEIGLTDDEIQRLDAMSVRKKEHLAYVTFDELQEPPYSLPAPCVRRLLSTFGHTPLAAPNPQPNHAHELLLLDTVTKSILQSAS
eukprot:TRINITY_DN2265_c0_g3_i1.p1 TRINITY_DN2265_c0_g3~~TRINITY_DN2265_c0_g3_i1.p1  ORF type:complete len:472 (+),score=124.56 TRINITY_DN2265_c0_g3_i1:47-1462(+)